MATDLQLYINLVSTLLGTSVLTIPWGLAGASVGLGCCMIVFALLWNGWTFCLLVDAADQLKVYDMGAILLHTSGRKAEVAFNVVNCLGIILCLAAYHVLFADVVTSLMGGNREAVMVLSAMVFYPLCFLDQSRLSTLSSMSVFSIFFILGLIVEALANNGPDGSDDNCWVGYGPGAVVTFSLVNAAVTVQMCIPPIFEDQEQRDGKRDPKRFKRLIWAALTTTGIINLSFGLSGALAFGIHVPGNVLVALPARSTTFVGRGSLLFVGAAGYSMLVYSLLFPIAEAAEEHLRQACSCWWFAVRSGSKVFGGCTQEASRKEILLDKEQQAQKSQSCAAQAFLRAVLVFMGMAIAIRCSELPRILVLSGNLSIIALMVVGPGVIGLHMSPGWSVYTHLTLGLAVFVVCCTITDNCVADLVCVTG